jgi:hypothetical protein
MFGGLLSMVRASGEWLFPGVFSPFKAKNARQSCGYFTSPKRASSCGVRASAMPR